MNARQKMIGFVVLAVGLVMSASAGARRLAEADAATVVCDVLVLDGDGAPIEDMSPDDIEVLSDGAPVSVVSFSPAPPELSVVLIADVTMSQPLKRYEVQNAVATSWMQSLIPADRARVAVLGSKTLIGPWFSADRVAEAAAVRAMIGRAEQEASPIWDAVDLAVQALAGAPGSKAVVLLTDGRATANRLSLDDVTHIAVTANVSVHSVSEGSDRVLPQTADAAARVRSDTSLQSLADETGGLFLPDGVARRTLRPRPDPFAWARELAQTPNRPGPLLARVMTTLRHRYRLAFNGASDGQTHTLEVRARRAGVVVRAQRRYVAAGALNAPPPRP